MCPAYPQAQEADELYIYSEDMSPLRQKQSGDIDQIVSPFTLSLENDVIVHLSGIEIPDFDMQTPGPLSVQTLTVLKDLFSNQRVFLFQDQTQTQNRFGHELAQLVRKQDNLWLQATLIKQGLARAYPFNMQKIPYNRLLTHEKEAREAKTGLWSEPAYSIKTDSEASDLVGQYALVQGTVKKAALVNNRVYLNFGENWRNDFTVGIEPDLRREFSKSGIDLLQFDGKTIRVRGFIEFYNGPFIRLSTINQIEVLSDTQNAEKDTTAQDGKDVQKTDDVKDLLDG